MLNNYKAIFDRLFEGMFLPQINELAYKRKSIIKYLAFDKFTVNIKTTLIPRTT